MPAARRARVRVLPRAGVRWQAGTRARAGARHRLPPAPRQQPVRDHLHETAGATPCGWDDFTTDVTARPPTGKWVGDAAYTADHCVCNPGQRCSARRKFSAFCRAVYAPPDGFAA